MARRKNSDAPTRSRKSITPTVAYARSKKAAPGDEAPSDEAPDDGAPSDEVAEGGGGAPVATEVPESTPTEMPESAPVEMPAEPEPSGTPEPTSEPEPATPVEIPAEPPSPEPAPPAAVAVAAPVAAFTDEVVGPIYEPLPKPRDITYEDPSSPAPPPGPVPRGDSRSMRRHGDAGEEFILIYRAMNAVISRSGLVGKRGTWKVVEYPTMGHASHAYAQECSRLVGQGFTDFRG